MDRVRKLILEEVRSGRHNYAALSRSCGKNHAYFQQFIERGVPAELPEKVRRRLASVLRIDESRLRLNGSAPERIPVEVFEAPDEAESLIEPPRGIVEIDVRAGMGGGGLPSEVLRAGNTVDAVKPETWSFPLAFVREELRAPPQRIVVIETQGDSMAPTIQPGERVLVDTGHHLPSPDGIYALRDRFGAVVIKRLQMLRNPPVLRVISDNPAHTPEDVGLDEVAIIGKVVGGWKRY